MATRVLRFVDVCPRDVEKIKNLAWTKIGKDSVSYGYWVIWRKMKKKLKGEGILPACKTLWQYIWRTGMIWPFVGLQDNWKSAIPGVHYSIHVLILIQNLNYLVCHSISYCFCCWNIRKNCFWVCGCQHILKSNLFSHTESPVWHIN